MKPEVKEALKKLLREALISKLDKYKAETEYKPFFDAIFSKEQVLTTSIMHSFYTTLGMSVYEQMAVILSKGAGNHAAEAKNGPLRR